MATRYILYFKILGFGCVICILACSWWFDFRNSSMLFEHVSVRSLTGQNYNISSDKWIVVTTVSEPTPDIKFLAEIPGWKVVVVGDTKTPNNWSYPNCVFLSVENQRKLGFETVSHLPLKSYARKSAGYLFAIAHGAKVIYETDDDNRPTDLLKNFELSPTMWGLVYGGEGLFNPYRHFGQPTLWPRGYPLSAVGENITRNYRLSHWKTPSIQQGIVNGDPDMDAIFRLTRKKSLSVLNVTFDTQAPPAIVPAGVFSPFNSQNTLFLYDALWALLIPTTTTFRVCDIWRGYWAQRLLWEMGGNLGFFPPNAFQKRNSHSYLLDAIDEKDLYFQTEQLVEYLTKWRCDTVKSFFDCVVQLSSDMASNRFWKDEDADLTQAWVNDLKALGYKEPERISFGSWKEGVYAVNNILLQNQTSFPSQIVNVTFWAAEQTPPLVYSQNTENKALMSHAGKISHYCKTVSTMDTTTTVSTFPNILLIVVFNLPHYLNIPILDTMYSMHFPHILYCGSRRDMFDNAAILNPQPVTFIEVDVGGGWFAHNCLTQAMRMNYNVDGYLYIGDDTLLNVWNLHKLPWDQLWLINDKVLRQSKRSGWSWFNRPKVGLKAYQVAIKASRSLSKERFQKFLSMLSRNTGYQDGLYKAPSDIAYVPRRLKGDVTYFLDHFSKFNLFVEIAIPTVFAGVDMWEKVYKLPGSYLWYDGKRKIFENFFHKDKIFLHPVKLSKELKSGKGSRFMCDRFLPLTTKDN